MNTDLNSQEQAEKDLADTNKDVDILHHLLMRLHDFKNNAQPGDDWNFVKLDIWKYQKLLDEAREIQGNIVKFLNEDHKPRNPGDGQP